MDEGDKALGYRVSRRRVQLGWTQQRLGDGVGVSQSHIANIEAGRKSVVTVALLMKLADALQLTVQELLDTPLPVRHRDDAIHEMVPEIRAALDNCEGSGRNLDQLAQDVSTVQLARMACDYSCLQQLLPGLIAEAGALQQNIRSRRAAELFVRVVVAASLTVRPHGYLDLSARLAERAQVVARTVDDPVLMSAADYVTAQTALGGGLPSQRRLSRNLAGLAANRVASAVSSDEAVWAGMNHLQAALSNASCGDEDSARAHLTAASDLARSNPADSWVQEFTATNVSAWAMAVALEVGDAGRALAALRSIDRSQLRTRQRQARYFGDAARVYSLAGQPQRAVTSLRSALETSPTDVRSRPVLQRLGIELMRSGCHDVRLPDVVRDLGVDLLTVGM